MPNAEIMVHEVSLITHGVISEVESKFEHSKSLNNRLQRIIVEKTKKTLEEIKNETYGKDIWMDSRSIKIWVC